MKYACRNSARSGNSTPTRRTPPHGDDEGGIGTDEAFGNRGTAAALDPDRPLMAQEDRIRRFFTLAGGVLSAMARPGEPGPGG